MSNNNFKISENASLSLDLIRAISAQIVLIGHGVSFMGIAMWLHPPNFPWIQEIAVVIFFLLSGLVVTSSTFGKMNLAEYDFKQFFLERFSRIYSAYIPILLLVAILDAFYLYYLDGINNYNSYNLKTFILNLIMLQDFPLFQICKSPLSVTSFGSARPIWTLAIEWWIYMFFGWFILGTKSIKNKFFYHLTLIFFSFVPLHNCVAGRGNGLGLVWIFGATIAMLLNSKINENLANQSLTFSLFFMTMAIIREMFVKIAYDVIFAFFLGGALYFLIIYLNNSQFQLSYKIRKSIKWWADYSFSLYLLHYSIFTIIVLFKNLYSPYLLFWLGIIISNILSMTVAYFTEMRHKEVKNSLFYIFRVHSVDKSKTYILESPQT